MNNHTPDPPDWWMRYDELTDTYDTRDGTKLPGEIYHGTVCFLDVLYIAHIMENQRAAIKAAKEEA